MLVFTDQAGRTIHLPKTPQRIISLVPSQTELLCHLGLSDEVVGITKFCIHPHEWFQRKPRVGGTKQVNLTRVHKLEPDLIIANKEENVREQIEELATTYPVWTSDIVTLEDAFEMITQVGALTAREPKAHLLVEEIRSSFSGLIKPVIPQKIAYLIWKDPYMVAGGDTFINTMIQYAGFENAFKDHSRYPVTDLDELEKMGCEQLLLSSEPFPYSEVHRDALREKLPGMKISLVDGEMFSWYGSRMLEAAKYFETLQK